MVIFLAFFFFPIAAYLFFLGMLNRRSHPVLVYGPWDGLGLLLASSGLVLFGGPTLISALYHQEVRDFLMGKPGWRGFPFWDLFAKWWVIALLYYAGVLIASAVMLWFWRTTTAVYNVDPAVFDDVLAQVLERLGVEWTRMGNRVFIGFRGNVRQGRAANVEDWSSLANSHVARAPLPGSGDRPRLFPARLDQEAVLDVEAFFSTRHVTLCWRTSEKLLRAEVESALARALNEVPAPENPAAAWFMLTASLIFVLIFFTVAASLVREIMLRRGGKN